MKIEHEVVSPETRQWCTSPQHSLSHCNFYIQQA